MNSDHINEWRQMLPYTTVAKMDAITSTVNDMRRNGQTIYPPQEDIFNALSLTDPKNIKVIIIGQDPYHEEGQAMGLAFSVRDGVPFPPSLKNILAELSDDLHIPVPTTGNLTPWARQGVLIMNTTLTVPAHKPLGHAKLGWQDVTSSILQTALMTKKPQVVLCWGQPAYKTATTVMPLVERTYLENTMILHSTHPSPFSANRSTQTAHAFMGSHPFSKTNAILEKYGETPIDWTLS